MTTTIKRKQLNALNKLFEIFDHNKSLIAKICEVSQSTVISWQIRGRISATAAIKIEQHKKLKNRLTKEELRPDVIDWFGAKQIAQSDNIELYSQAHEIPLHVAAVRMLKNYKNTEIWPDPIETGLISQIRETPQLILEQTQGLIADMARAVAESIQFPVNTVYLHAFGVCASAMTKSFSYNYHGSQKPITLYVCSAQPPSTGKSGVNDYFLKPVEIAYDEINKENRVKRRKLQQEINAYEKKLTKDQHENSLNSVHDLLDRALEELNNTPIWLPALTDVTIEAADKVAKNQTGMINIISDEAEAINTIIGNTYKNDKNSSKSNYGLMLAAWDGDRVKSERVGRDAYKGPVRGTIAVLAQDDSVESILRAGATGRGLAERFLLLAEKNYLGIRDHTKRKTVNKNLYLLYSQTIKNIVYEKNVCLDFDEEALEAIGFIRNQVEKEIGEGGIYEHNLITGFMGKMDKQILKIACVIHVMENWQPGESRDKKVSYDKIITAYRIFSELAKTYINAADALGYAGNNSETNSLIEVFYFKAKKNETIFSIRKLVNDIKKRKPFSGMRNLTKRLRENILPKLEENNYCVVKENDIYLNPKLKK